MVIRVHWKIGRIGLYTYTGHKHKITASTVQHRKLVLQEAEKKLVYSSFLQTYAIYRNSMEHMNRRNFVEIQMGKRKLYSSKYMSPTALQLQA